MDWVTDPQAIEILFGLGEIRPGDEVKLGPLPDKPAPTTIGKAILTGAAVTVDRVELGDSFRGEFSGLRIRPLKRRIIAWRRPE